MHILLSRTDRIGDLILSTAAIATVRASFPGARITMVCSPYNRIVMERNTDVDEIVDLESDANPAQLGAAYRGAVNIAIALAPRIQDLALVGGTRAGIRVGYTYVRRYVARLTSRLYVNRVMISEADPNLSERNPHRHVRHEVNQLIDLVALAGARNRVEQLRLDVTAGGSRVNRLLAERTDRPASGASLVSRRQHAGLNDGSDSRSAPFRHPGGRHVCTGMRALRARNLGRSRGRRGAGRTAVPSLGRRL